MHGQLPGYQQEQYSLLQLRQLWSALHSILYGINSCPSSTAIGRITVMSETKEVWSASIVFPRIVWADRLVEEVR